VVSVGFPRFSWAAAGKEKGGEKLSEVADDLSQGFASHLRRFEATLSGIAVVVAGLGKALSDG